MTSPEVTSVRFMSSRTGEETSDLELHARLYLPPHSSAVSRPGLVVGHGAGSYAERHHDFCLVACDTGFAVLALDFRGHGRSAGEGDGPLELDVLAGVRFLREHPGVDPKRITYRGSSMGGFYGLKAAPKASFSAMVLLCPASAGTMLGAIRRIQEKEKSGDEPDPAHWNIPRMHTYFEAEVNRSLGRDVDCPVFIVHARGDETVLVAETLALAEELPGETQVLLLPGGSHTSAQHDPGIQRLTAAWLWDKVNLPE